MPGINYLAVLVAAIAAFIMSSVYYILFGKQWTRLNPGAASESKRPPAWKMIVEVARGFVVAWVLARLVVLLGVVGWLAALHLGLWLWIGFPAMILVGSVLWDKRPWELAAIHAGDWLVKLLLMAVILAKWR
jgi:hypothetical protein